jgi:hypothetical protein
VNLSGATIASGRAYNLSDEEATMWNLFDIRRAMEELGWRNRSLVDGMRETLAEEAAAEGA